MGKRLLFFVLFIAYAFGSFGNEPTYSRIKIFTDQAGMVSIAQLGINLEITEVKPDVFIIAELSGQELEMLTRSGFQYEVLINDMAAYYVQRNSFPGSATDLHSGTRLNKDYPIPNGFALGSLGGFCTYDEFLAHLDQLRSMYPGLISAKQTVSQTIQTIEGRPVYMVRISNNPTVYQPGKPKVLYTGMIHAREGIGMQHLLYFMYYILQNYQADPEIKYMIDNTELYFVPVSNPDGWIYNQTTNPGGGGMWRKNRRQNAGGSFGVDLNRNFGYMWGYNNTGSSPTPSSDTYRGTAAFSEPETQMLKQLCENIPFSIALNYHSYSNLLLYPWGYIFAATPDNALFQTHARYMTAENKYVYGIASSTIYQTNGSSDDYMYGEQASKTKIYSYTPEIGSTADGFWPTMNRIIPLCQENMLQSMLAGLFTLHYGKITERGNILITSHTGHIAYDLQRLGLQQGAFTVSVQALSPAVLSVGGPRNYPNLTILQTVTDSIAYSLNPGIAAGTSLKFLITLNNGFITKTDTLTKVFGVTEVAFFDDCTNMSKWTGLWGTTNEAFKSLPTSITDSPNIFYSFNTNKSVTTNNTIDLSNAVYARLNFWTRWDIEVNYDYVQLRISTDNGATWAPLAGKFTRPGTSNQLVGQPLYDGVQSAWVYEDIDLAAYVGRNIRLRFTLVSDNSVNGDGFYFDDLQVTVINALPNLSAQFSSSANIVLQGTKVQFNDISAGVPQTWSWLFPGGTPSSSNQQNPQITYSLPGMYDVTLTVTRGTSSQTNTLPNYMRVLDSVLCRPQVFAGANASILPAQTYQASGASASNYSSLQWTSTGDGTFNNAVVLNTIYTPGNQDITNKKTVLILTAQPVYSICRSGTSTLTLTINPQTGVDAPSSEKINIFPNPSKGSFSIMVRGNENPTSIEIFLLTGLKVYRHVPGNGKIDVNVSGLAPGVYLLRMNTVKSTLTGKLIIAR